MDLRNREGAEGSRTAAPAMLASCRDTGARPLPRQSCCSHHARCEKAIGRWKDLHKGIIDRNDEDLTSIFELGRLDVTGDMGLATGRTEGCWDT